MAGRSIELVSEMARSSRERSGPGSGTTCGGGVHAAVFRIVSAPSQTGFAGAACYRKAHRERQEERRGGCSEVITSCRSQATWINGAHLERDTHAALRCGDKVVAGWSKQFCRQYRSGRGKEVAAEENKECNQGRIASR